MHKREEFRIGICFERVFDLVEVDRSAPVILHHHRHCTAALDVLLHAAAENAVLANYRLVTALEQIRKHCLHTGRARGRNRQGKLILSLEHVLQQRLHFVHHIDKCRIEMTNSRPRECLKNARVNIRRTRTHERSHRWMKRVKHGSPVQKR